MAFLGRLVVWAQNHSGAPGPALWAAFPGPQSAGFCPSVASAGRIQACPRWWAQPALIPPLLCLATQAGLRETLVLCSSAVFSSLC